MHELGTPDRLSAVAWSRAIMVRRRARIDAWYKTENGILGLEESEPSCGPAAVMRKEQGLGLPMLDIDGSNASAKQTKAKVCHHASTVVIPAMRAHEQTTWHSCARNLEHWQSYSGSYWTVHQFAVYAASGTVAPCRFCATDSSEALEHLFFECDVAMQFTQHVPAWVDHATRCAVGANLSDPRCHSMACSSG